MKRMAAALALAFVMGICLFGCTDTGETSHGSSEKSSSIEVQSSIEEESSSEISEEKVPGDGYADDPYEDL